jgi:hypothetical protein
MLGSPYNIPTKASSDAVWMDWHKILKSNFGRKTANHLFTLAWEKGGSSAANTVSLRSYATDNKLEIDANIFQNIASLGSDFGDSIGDFFKLSKYASIAILVMLIGAAGVMAFTVAKKPVELIKAIRG